MKYEYTGRIFHVFNLLYIDGWVRQVTCCKMEGDGYCSFQLSAADTMLSASEHKVSQPSFSQNRSSNSTGLDIDKTEVGLSYSAPNTATYQTSYQSQKSSGTGYQQASSYSSSNYSSTQVSPCSSSLASRYKLPAVILVIHHFCIFFNAVCNCPLLVEVKLCQ